MEWQTIDSAPRDGTLVILLSSHKSPRVSLGKFCYYSRSNAWSYTNLHEVIGQKYQPTHWMPLPATHAAKTPIHPTHGASEGQETTIARQFYGDKARYSEKQKRTTLAAICSQNAKQRYGF